MLIQNTLEKWKTDEMYVLRYLVSKVRYENSQNCPIKIAECTKDEIVLISRAFDAACSGMFEQIPEKDVCALIPIAVQLEAIGMLTLCAKKGDGLYEPFLVDIFKKIKQCCSGYEWVFEKEDFTHEQIQFLYQLYCAGISGNILPLKKDSALFHTYEKLSADMKKMVKEVFGLVLS